MRLTILLLIATLLAPAPLAAAEAIQVANCILAPDDEVVVPAQESGVLTAMPVRDGQVVKKGALLAQIDDLIPQAQCKVAEAKLKAAQEEANSDVAERYAAAAAATAEAAYLDNKAANDKFDGAVTREKMRELLLKWHEMALTIEKAQKDRIVAGCQAEVSKAEVEAAAVNRDHRRIVSPIDGEVIDIKPHVGEWVQAGDRLMTVIRINRLRVEGFVNITECHPAELRDRPVRVTVEMARGQKVALPGKIVYVRPVVDTGGTFTVRAEVQNQQENGAWLLRPGLTAEMKIEP